MDLKTIITPFFTTATLLSHILWLIIVFSFIFRKTWGRKIVYFIGKNALVLGFAVSLLGIAGSLSYSNIVGFPPCILCWWQRIFIYPNLILFLVALKGRDHEVFKYVLPLSSIGGIIALYHSYIHLGGSSITPCTALGSACAKVYVLSYGYITIPMMSLTIAVYLVTLSLIYKYYAKNNSNS